MLLITAVAVAETAALPPVKLIAGAKYPVPVEISVMVFTAPPEIVHVAVA